MVITILTTLQELLRHHHTSLLKTAMRKTKPL